MEREANAGGWKAGVGVMCTLCHAHVRHDHPAGAEELFQGGRQGEATIPVGARRRGYRREVQGGVEGGHHAGALRMTRHP